MSLKIFSRKLFVISFLMSIPLCTNAQSFGLDYYMEQAINYSPLLQKQNNNKKIIELDLKQFNSIYKSPKISLNSSVLFAPIISKDGGRKSFNLVSDGSTDYVGYDLGISNGGQYQAVLTVNQPLFTSKFSKVQKDIAKISTAQNENEITLTKAELKQVVTHQYILTVQAQKQKDNSIKTIEIIEEQLEQMKALVYSGIYKLNDLKLLEIELQNNQIECERFNSELSDNLNSLNLLCGIDDSTTSGIKDINLELTPQLDSASIFLSRFQLDSLKIKAEQKNFDLQYLPQINAFADAGLNAVYLPAFNRLGFSFGLSLNWNLFDGNQRSFKKAQTKILLENIAIDKNYFQDQNVIRKKNLLDQIDRLDKQLKIINQQFNTYNELLELYKLELKHGLVSAFEIKSLIKEINDKEQEKTNSMMEKEILINSYNYWNN